MKRLSSFTVIELVMALFISSIVITICYYVFFLMNSRFRAFHTRSQQVSEYRLFCKAIERDASEALAIRNSEDKHLYFEFGNKNVADYFFYDSSVVRRHEANADTFALVSSLSPFTYINDSIPLISLIKINITMNKESLPVTVHKDYTPKELINHYTIPDEQSIP